MGKLNWNYGKNGKSKKGFHGEFLIEILLLKPLFNVNYRTY